MNWAAWWATNGDLVLGVVIGGVISALIDWFFFRKGMKAKRLNWLVTSRNRIINKHKTVLNQREHLKVVFKGQEVANPSIFVIRIGNTGRKEIIADDFPEPVTIDFGDRPILADDDVVSRSNPGVSGVIRFDTGNPNEIGFKPKLLNPGDWLDFQFVIDGDLETPEITAHFAGQSSPGISNAADYVTLRSLPFWLTPGFVLAIFVVSAVIIRDEPATPQWFKVVVATSITVLFVFSLFFAEYWANRIRGGIFARTERLRPIDTDSS